MMRRTASLWARIATQKSLLRGKNVLTLEHFMQKKKALSLWREIMRAISKIPGSPTKREMRDYARTEFERHRDVQDIGHIRYLISTGRTQFDGMKRYINEQVL